MKFNGEEFKSIGIGSIRRTADAKKIIYTDLINNGGLVLLTSESPINVILNPAGEWEFSEND